MKKILAFLLAAIMVLSLAACANSADEGTTGGDEVSSDDTSRELKIGCTAGTEVGASMVVDQLVALGYTAEVVMFDSNEGPVTSLKDGDIDGVINNHMPWLQTYNANNGCELTVAEPYFYYSPYAIYSTKHSSIDELPDGAVISIPNDPTNMQRSLIMLQDLGLITLGETTEAFLSIADIVENPKNISFTEVEMTNTARYLEEVDACFSAAIYIYASGVKDPQDWLYLDPTCENYTIGLIVRPEDKEAEWAVGAMTALQDPALCEEFKEKTNNCFLLYADQK